ncbi:Gonad-specific amiloride-sensitive sodium channel 1 [Operophtera brumata]|uniref:Gonad-specific amiloride-sensitive sodium channel 1 n=1 Tax=Operophtera brumata TaxID=104452 RepID=A0A0L7KMU4_OPEBR|nr:Gonad-specific amiloride-sensitive sodium channel 1 [Operophtera brumata]
MKTELEKVAYMYADEHRIKQRRRQHKFIIMELFLDYAEKSTLHGLRYFTEKGITFVEKLFWVATFITSIILCCFLINNVYVKWKTSPVIVTVNEKLFSVGNVPFPSVTICPEIKSKARVYNFTEHLIKYNQMTGEELAEFADINISCGSYVTLDDGKPGRNNTNSSIVDHITEVAPNESDTFFFCILRLRVIPCELLFKKVYTSQGLCFNMNGLAAEEMFRNTVQSDYNYSARDVPSRGWSMATGYYSEDNPFPLRGSENSAYADLMVTLHTHVNDSDGLCNAINSGYKIYLQHPADFPQSSVYKYAAHHGHVSSLAVSFHVINTSDTLSGYTPEIRQCYFLHERYLRYFQIYTAQNCRAECLSNYTFKLCNCVGYYMPHDNSKQICTENSLSCMLLVEQNMALVELHLKEAGDGSSCHCLPACESIEFDAEILKSEYNGAEVMKKLSDFKRWDISIDTDAYKFSRLDIYFKKPQFISMRRSELFGLTDFLANIGGLLGLFLGFSFLSLVEIIYFITLRLGFKFKRNVNEEKLGHLNSIKVS